MPSVFGQLAASLRRALGADARALPLDEAAAGLKALYWELRDARDFARDTALTDRAQLLARSLAAAAATLEAEGRASSAQTLALRESAAALASWPRLEQPFDGQVFEGPLTRETAAVVALTSMRRAELLASPRAAPRPRPSSPHRLRTT